MRRLNMLLFFSMTALALQAQFINNGATVTIQAGATLRVETDINNISGTITNNGTIEVQGNFTNSATGVLTPNIGLIKFFGTVNKTLEAGGDALFNVEMAKTANGRLNILSNTTIDGNLNFSGTGSRIQLDGFDLSLGTGSTVTTPGANGYVITNGVGRLAKKVNANGTFTFPVGDDATDYSPLTSTYVANTYSSASLKVKVTDLVHPSKPTEATSFITRYWPVEASGMTGSYSNTWTGTYVPSDVNGTQASIKGASYFSPDWTFAGAATNGTSTVTGTETTVIADFTGLTTLTSLNLTAFLFGDMPNAGTTMNSYLQNYFGGNTGLLPVTSQYGAPSSTYAAINNTGGVVGGVVDWVKVQIRSAANPATILETRSLLLKPNGSIVNVENKTPYFIAQASPVRVSVAHRNHLGVLSNDIASFNGTSQTYNFSTALSQANNDFADPAQMVLKNGVWCMISADINIDYSVDANDVSLFFPSLNAGDFDLYLSTDLNLDGAVDANDVSLFFPSLNAGYYSTLLNY